MENKIKKTDIKSKVLKDAGDVKKVDKPTRIGSQVENIIEACDRGDSIAKIGIDRIKVTDKKQAETKPVENVPNNETRIQKKEDKRKREDPMVKDLMARKAEMKKIRDNYTFKNRASMKKDGECGKNSAEKAEAPKIQTDDSKSATPSNSTSSQREHSKSVFFPKEVIHNDSSTKPEPKRRTSSKTTLSQQLIRRPIIKTITSKNDRTKVYKAVKFVEKRVHPTHLEINIPRDRSRETRVKPETSKVSVKEKRKRDKKRQVTRSPSDSPVMTVKLKSPPTEVAKWASVDKHTKLYYEAWVDTTLAAISKKVKDKKFDKKKLLETFQQALAERPLSPEFKLFDEKYTGKIKVNKR